MWQPMQWSQYRKSNDTNYPFPGWKSNNQQHIRLLTQIQALKEHSPKKKV